MWSFAVVDSDEFVEARLLLQEIRGSRFGGFFFQSEMHPFVTTVLLGMTRLDAFDANAYSWRLSEWYALSGVRIRAQLCSTDIKKAFSDKPPQP